MKNTFLLLFFVGMSLVSVAQKRVVVMGSSTAAGTGSSSPDSSWVGRLQKWYRRNPNDGLDTVVYNIAWYGQTSFSQMPTGWTSAYPNRPAVDPDHNVTKALSFSPDVVIINLPSNDVANLYWGPAPDAYSTKETMDNFRTMAQVFAANGVASFFTTTQPRDDMDFTKRQMNRQLLDSISNNFGSRAIDFWNPIVSTDGQYFIRPDLKSDDVHVNNTGHRLLYEQVITKNLFGSSVTTAPPAPTGSFGKIEAEVWSAMSGVQTESTSDAGGGLNVGYIDLNDWMDYSLNVPATGSYTVKLRVASQQSGGELQLRKSDGTVLATVSLPNTGGWQTWTTITANLSLAQGVQTMRILSTKSPNWNINWFELTAGTTTTTPPPVNATSLPAKVEAENWSAMSGVQTETTTDAGGGQNVGYIDLNDWMEYTVSVATAGSFTFSFRVATPSSGAVFQVRKEDGTVLGTVNVPVTGGWQTWQTATAVFSLPAGTQTLRIVSTATANWNINWWQATAGGTTTPPPPPPTSSVLRIEAENWSAMSGVQTEATSDAGGGLNVGYIDNGDWMDYNVNLASAGSFTATFRVASQWSGAQFQVRKSDGTVLATVTVPNTGGWQSWQSVNAVLNLPAGQQTLRLLSVTPASWNINWWEIAAGGTTAPPSPTVSSKVEAENWSAMSGVQTETTTDAGGGQNVGYIDLNDWMEYSITTAAAGSYTIAFRLASLNSGGQFEVRKSDGSRLATVNVPNTGGWQSWTTVSVPVTLASGTQTIRLVSVAAANWNINWFEIGSLATAARAAAETTEAETAAVALQLFPNPVSDRLMIVMNDEYAGPVQLDISDVRGLPVRTLKLQKNGRSLQTAISVSNLPAGEYVLVLRSGKSVVTRKLVKL